MRLCPVLPALAAVASVGALAHDGPDPIGSWRLSEHDIVERALAPMLGATGAIEGKIEIVGEGKQRTLFFDGATTRVVLEGDIAREGAQVLPKRHMTIEAWVAVNTPRAASRSRIRWRTANDSAGASARREKL